MSRASNVCSYTTTERSSNPVVSIRMAKKELTTQELRRKQKERTTGEHQAIPNSVTPDEESQHRRRADKSAYLESKLAERERSERRAERERKRAERKRDEV